MKKLENAVRRVLSLRLQQCAGQYWYIYSQV